MKTAVPARAYRCALALLLCVLTAVVPLMGESPAATPAAGQINALVPAASRNNEALKLKEEVSWNDVLRTDRSGRARVSLRDGSILSLGSGSEVKVVEHDPNGQQTLVQLNAGKLRSRVVSLTRPGAKFEIRTPLATVNVLGTDFFVQYDPPSNTFRAICYSGTVMVSGVGPYAGRSETIRAGQMLEIGQSGFGAPRATSNAVQQDSIAETAAEGSGNSVASDSHLLRNVLIGAAVAAAGVVVGMVATGGSASQTGAASSQKKTQGK